MVREGRALLVRASGSSDQPVVLGSLTPGAKWAGNVLRIPLPAIEAGLSHALPEPGSTTQQMKVLDQRYSSNGLTLTLSAPGNSRHTFMVRVNDIHEKLHVEGAQMAAQNGSSLRPVQADFGPGDGYVEKTVKFTW